MEVVKVKTEDRKERYFVAEEVKFLDYGNTELNIDEVKEYWKVGKDKKAQECLIIYTTGLF